MARTRATIKLDLASVASDAVVLIDQVRAGSVTSVQAYEAEANRLRARIKALLSEVETEWGVRAQPVLRQLRALAARLVDLRAAVASVTATITVTTTRETSLLELAVEHYRDHTRWPSLAKLNRQLMHPGFIAAGVEVVLHVR